MKRRAVANYLKRARLAAGYPTQASFAKAAGVTQQQISNYEKNGRIPQESVARIARALVLPVDELAMMLVEAAEEDERAIRRNHDATLEEMHQIVEDNRAINRQIGEDIAAIREMFSQLRGVLEALLTAVIREPPPGHG